MGGHIHCHIRQRLICRKKIRSSRLFKIVFLLSKQKACDCLKVCFPLLMQRARRSMVTLYICMAQSWFPQWITLYRFFSNPLCSKCEDFSILFCRSVQYCSGSSEAVSLTLHRYNKLLHALCHVETVSACNLSIRTNHTSNSPGLTGCLLTMQQAVCIDRHVRLIG